MLAELIQKYFQIAVLKIAPQELPGHVFVLWLSAAVALLSSMAGLLFAYDFAEAFYRSLLAIVIPGVLVYAMLGVKNLQARFVQTYSALCGSAAIIYLIALPLMPAFFTAMSDPQSGKVVVTLVLLLDLWTIAITAHVLKHSFDVGFATGISLAVVLVIFTVMTIQVVAPSDTVDQQSIQSEVLPTMTEHLLLGACAVEVCVARTCHDEDVLTII